jgi:uncharacterized protein
VKKFAGLFVLLCARALADSAACTRAMTNEAYAAAFKECLPPAKEGDASAQDDLGVLYSEGQGVPQDYQEAARWFRLAADQGNTLAQASLGALYSLGRGVPQDDIQAHMWLNLASASGHDADAAKVRDIVASKMTPQQIAEAQRLARKWKPLRASKQKDWKTGKVLDSNSARTSIIVGTLKAIDIRNTQLAIAGKEFAYVVNDNRTVGASSTAAGGIIEGIANRRHGCRFIVNDTVRFYQDKAILHVVDADGKECRTDIVRQERLKAN